MSTILKWPSAIILVDLMNDYHNIKSLNRFLTGGDDDDCDLSRPGRGEKKILIDN